MREVVLYTRSGCCLCDEAKHALQVARAQVRFILREVDIDSDPALQAAHRFDVPVIAIDADELRATPAPAFSLPDRDGKPVDLSAYRGKVVLLNFWATWCPPCRDEEPSLRKLTGAMDPGTFQLVAVSVDEGGWPAIDKFFGSNRPPYAVALDHEARISQIYGTTKFPESYLIDSSGTLRLKFIGPRNWTDPAVFTLLSSYGASKRG